MTVYGAIYLVACSFDVLITIILIDFFSADEYNYILKFYFDYGGDYGLIFAKLFLSLCSLFLMEFSYHYLERSSSRHFLPFVMVYRLIIGVYIIILPVGSIYVSNFNLF